MLRVAEIGRSVVDGPGARAVIHFQGCSIQCPGCTNTHLWPFEGGEEMNSHELRDKTVPPLNDKLVSGITLSGGEPFDQPWGDLVDYLERVRHDICWPHNKYFKSVILYTGYDREQLMSKFGGRYLALCASGTIDLLVAGPYKEEFNLLDTVGLRGSSNQQYVPLTDLGRKWVDNPDKYLRRKVSIRVDQDGVPEMRGFPSRELIRSLPCFSSNPVPVAVAAPGGSGGVPET